MRFLKIFITFAVGFTLAWIVVLTFGQSEFRQTAALNLFFYKTRALPIYLFLAGTFGLGLLTGLLVALANFISNMSKTGKLKKQMRRHEETIRTLESQLSQKNTAAIAATPADDAKYMPPPAHTPDVTATGAL